MVGYPRTPADKWTFLTALYRNGTNSHALQEALPNVPSADLKHGVKRYRTRAVRQMMLAEKKCVKEDVIVQWRNLLNNCHDLEGTGRRSFVKSNISSWCLKNKLTSNDYSYLLGKSMKFAACFEEHYQGPTPDTPNYSEIYYYLSDLLSGNEPRQLRPGSAAKVLQMLGALKKLVTKSENADRYTNYLMSHLQSGVSYIDPLSDPRQVPIAKKEQAEQILGEGEFPDECPLFSDVEQVLSIAELDKSLPDYEQKRDALIEEFTKQQTKLSFSVLNIPGLNPLEITSDAVIKPPVALLMSSERQ